MVSEVLRLQVVVCRVQVVSMHRRSSCAGPNVQQHSWLNVLWQLKRNLSIRVSFWPYVYPTHGLHDGRD
jgi:hypothetical protein